MCGIAGCFVPGGADEGHRALVCAMNDRQHHRGPDDKGIWKDGPCVLGHRRLSIIDLSRDGHQPFSSPDGRYHLTYNGEIYNYIELRAKMENRGIRFRTQTDTEVLLQAYIIYGRECLEKFNGMFAFAVYDVQERCLFMARDRIGIKPLYYCQQNGVLYFASELKAFYPLPGYRPEVNTQAVFDFLVFNRTDIFDETFFAGVRRLPKGHYAVVDDAGMHTACWWSPEPFVHNGSDMPADERQAADRVRELMVSSATLRMRSDVPVGSCLSGGLDSSVLTGILYRHAGLKDHYATFTSSFPGHPIDESVYVDMLNARYPFINHRTFPDGESCLEDLPRFTYFMDEPVNDATFYSQYRVMRLAREKGVTVLLDGQGGDENFAGYQYFHGFYLAGLLHTMRPLYFGTNLVKTVLRHQHMSAYQTMLFQLMPGAVKKMVLRRSVPLMTDDFFEAHIGSSRIFNEFFDAPDLNTSLMRHFQYKLEHLLRMEDRNSMAFSLEARVPYLDHRLVEYCLGIPADMKIKAGHTKYLQKTALGDYTVPEILNRRDKIGFGVPRDDWMVMPVWEEQTCENLAMVDNAIPGILKRPDAIPAGSHDRWKINQLGSWLNMVQRETAGN